MNEELQVDDTTVVPPLRRRGFGNGSKRQAVEAQLKADPKKHGVDIARELGVSEKYVSSIRNALGHRRYKTPRSGKNNGGKVELPYGVVLSEHVRNGLQQLENQKPDSVADALKMSRLAYRHARAIVQLADRTDLAAADHAMAQEALRMMDDTNRTKKPYKHVERIVKRLWGAHGVRTSRGEASRMEAFRKAITVLHQVCETASQVEIPYIDPREWADVSAQLKECRANLARLWRRVAVRPSPEDAA